MPITRRSFLSSAAMLAAGNAMGLRPFGALNALAATGKSTSGYRALVCVFLYGGNDANNMLVQNESAGYSNYASLRGNLALAQKTLLPLGTDGKFALNPNMPELQSLYNNKNAALVANVGTLLTPTTRAQYLAASVETPVNLFSHSDQQLEWQNQADSAATGSGWAGRIADQLTTQMNPGAIVPMIASLDGDALFCNGAVTGPVSVATAGPSSAACAVSGYCSLRQATAQQLAAMSSGVTLVQADNAITNNAVTYNGVLSSALAGGAGFQTQFPTSNNPFSSQLLEVAKLIQVQSALEVTRQIFFVGAGNFDTHSNQLNQQSTLLANLSSALGAFYSAMEEISMQDNVTAFTCSDFARALQPNSTSGSDHAWGSHHIVMGGAVKGGALYGTFPTLELGGANDAGSNGRWIPTTAASQYAATLAQWYGVNAADLSAVLPYIGNFPVHDLGFLG